MGGHYGSVQVRSEDRERVRAVAEQVASEKQIHILLAPPVNGWIAIFPEGHGQDDSVGRAIAERLDCDVLHLLVHDDDIFAYWLYRDRRLLDSYWSAPGYFGEANREKEEAMAGNPEVFRPLIEAEVAQLPALLDRDTELTFEYERLEQFAKLLKITNAVNAYEYLKEGERTGIKNWRQFIEVPAERVISHAKLMQQERKLILAAQKRLKSAGLLLMVDARKQGMPYGCAAGSGFLVAWADHRQETVSFSLCNEPWGHPAPISLGTCNHVAGIVSDTSAGRIAFTAGKRVSVWDLRADQWMHICDVPESDHAVGVAISSDGQLLVHSSRKEVVINRINPGAADRVLAWPTERTPQGLAFHPSGEWVAVSGDRLGLIAIHEEEPWRDLYVGGKWNPEAGSRAVFRAKMQDIDLDAIEKKQQATIDATISRILKAEGRSKQRLASPEQIEAMKREMVEQFAKMTSNLRALQEGRLPPAPFRSREQIRCVGFSRDGRWFWCGTSAALRVYEWTMVPRNGGADMPAPRWSFKLPGTLQFEGGDQVYAVIEEADAPAIAFGGGTGRLYRLDLVTGEARELIKVGENTAIVGLALSQDGKALGMATGNTPSPERAIGPRDLRPTWTVWSYPKLRGPFMRAEL